MVLKKPSLVMRDMSNHSSSGLVENPEPSSSVVSEDIEDDDLKTPSVCSISDEVELELSEALSEELVLPVCDDELDMSSGSTPEPSTSSLVGDTGADASESGSATSRRSGGLSS